MEIVVEAVVDAVERRRREHGDGVDALRRITSGPDDLHGGIAAAILGDAELARSRVDGQVHDPDRASANSS